jgi:hypothetical protein
MKLSILTDCRALRPTHIENAEKSTIGLNTAAVVPPSVYLNSNLNEGRYMVIIYKLLNTVLSYNFPSQENLTVKLNTNVKVKLNTSLKEGITKNEGVCEISVSHGCQYEDESILGCSAV